MKILMVNKFYYIKGGSETYYFSLKKLLEEKGHTVIDFSMDDKRNFTSPYKEYFVSNIDYNNTKGILKKIKSGAKIIYSLEAKKKFEKLVIAENPDIIHLHIFQHQISPSILDVAKKYNIPVVYTAHDLKMICPNYKMMHHGKICEDCKYGSYSHCVKNRCVKDSLLKSCINAAEGYLHKWRKSYDTIDVIVTPSQFYRRKFIEFGIDSRRITYIPNFLSTKNSDFSLKENALSYYLYFGRLSEEKGILTLVKAFSNTDMKLYIVGGGPLEEEIKDYLCNNRISNVSLLGFKKGQELKNIVGNSKAVILPSEWYENGPYSAIEALQAGRPIIGANIGGIPELVKNNGYLFEKGNVDSLKSTLITFEKLSPEEYAEFSNNSIKLFNTCYTKDVHWGKLKRVYDTALKKHGKNLLSS